MRFAMPDQIKFPEKLQFLFERHRYKVAYGGRSSAKSWSFARALLVQGASAPTRVLCAREIQKSIKDSVHQLLKDQVEVLGLEDFYQVLDNEIRGANGTQFTFCGLSQQTVASIKSYEGIDIVWVEEAQNVSKHSWNVLIPTIRKDDSEIWVSFNPELDTDETYQRFVVHPPADACVVQVNYTDNPWFNDVMEQERIHCKETAPEDYDTIWLGKCRSAVVGAIYACEVDAAIRDGRICRMPYDPKLRVHTIWDMGWNDSMFIIMAQRMRSEMRIIDVIQNDHKTLDWYVAELQTRRWNWGFDFLPHDAYHGDYKTGKSADQLLKAFGRKTKPIPNIKIEDGIRQARMMFPQCIFDRKKADPLIESLKRLRRRVNKATGEDEGVFHDANSHAGDAFRYLALVADQLTNASERKLPKMPRPRASVPGMGI